MNALAAALLLVLAAQEEKLTIKDTFQKGDKVVRRIESNLKAQLYVQEGNMEGRSELLMKFLDHRTLHIRDVADGKPTKVTHEIHQDSEEYKVGDEDWKKEESPLTGKRITFALRAGYPTYEDAEGLPSQALAQLFVESDMHRLHPKRPVSVGDAWDVTAKDIRAILGDDFDKGKINLKFTEIREVAGRRCAEMKVKMEFSGTFDVPNIDIRVKVDGEARVELDRGLLVNFRGRGTSRVHAKLGTLELAGAGSYTVELSSKVE